MILLEREISTRKEELMIDYYKKLNKQVILSATLKIKSMLSTNTQI